MGLRLRLSDFPCWWIATPGQVAEAEATARRVVDPAWAQFGPLVVTSWMWWQDGCRPRTGAHSDPGTLDLVPLRAPVGQVARWIAAALPASYGTIIDERDHIHVTRPGFQGRTGYALYEPEEGVYVPMTWGDGAAPLPVPGVGVTVSRWGPFALPALLVLAALALRGARARDGRRRSYLPNPYDIDGWWYDEHPPADTEADEEWGAELADDPLLVAADGGPVGYDDFPSGLTFAAVAAMLDAEAAAKLRASGERMFITRNTILGRWHELKSAAYDAYLREFGR